MSAGLAVLSFIQLPVQSSPDVEGYPIPTLLVVVGLLLGVVLALLAVNDEPVVPLAIGLHPLDPQAVAVRALRVFGDD